jgi:hypothetical protein
MRSFVTCAPSPSIIRVIKSGRVRWEGSVERMGGMRVAYNILVGRPEGKGPRRRPRCRWKYNARMDIREIWTGVCVCVCVCVWTGFVWLCIGTISGLL